MSRQNFAFPKIIYLYLTLTVCSMFQCDPKKIVVIKRQIESLLMENNFMIQWEWKIFSQNLL